MNSNSFLRGEDQERHLVATHQREPAIGAEFRADGDAHLIQQIDAAVQGANGDAIFGIAARKLQRLWVHFTPGEHH